VLDDRWLLNNITREVGDERSNLFWKDSWLDGSSLNISFKGLFELFDDKLITVADMHALGRDVNGEAWKRRRRQFAREEELVRECVDRLSNVVLQV